jgi:uncharacterized membrane protein
LLPALFKGIRPPSRSSESPYLVSTEAIVSTIIGWSHDQLAHMGRLGRQSPAPVRQHLSVEAHNFYAHLLSHDHQNDPGHRPAARETVAYPASFAVFEVIAYQLYRYSFTHDFGLIRCRSSTPS